MTSLGQGNNATETQIFYIYPNPRLRMKTSVYQKRPIDLIGHFCFIPGLEHLIHDDKVNELFIWKHPAYQEDDLYLFEEKGSGEG